jgi:hypothetical protein
MTRTRIRLSVIATAMALVAVCLGLAVPAPRRIHVRWAAAATSAERVRAEQELRLTGRDSMKQRTWSYELSDDSSANIARLVAHPLVEDTHNVDRERLTLAPELPAVRASVRRMYQHRLVRAATRWWPAVAALLFVTALGLAWPVVRTTFGSDPRHGLLAGLLAVSLLLRFVLIFSGGQFYWPDEGRYQEVRESVAALAARDRAAATKAFEEPAHVLFKALAAVPAGVELLRGEDSRIPACVFGIFSVVNIWLVVKIARRLDAGRDESLLAGTLFAACSSSLYYSRHVLPYDLAMTFDLLAIHAGTARKGSWRSSLACGLWAACAFLTYAGYWTLGGAACVIHVLDAPGLRNGARRSVLAALALATTLGIVMLIYTWFEMPLVQSLLAFAGTVTQGNPGEGWRLPLEYLWHAEHLLLVLWLAALAWCMYDWRFQPPKRTVKAGVAGIAFVYGALVICSVGLNVFVVYGRLARQLIPFLCLITATVLMNGTERAVIRARTVALIMAATIIQAAVNFSTPLTQQFPAEFTRRGEAIAERAGIYEPVTAFMHHINGAPEPFTTPPGYRELAAARHPLQFLPYQYEGFTPREREALRSADIRMRVLVPANR